MSESANPLSTRVESLAVGHGNPFEKRYVKTVKPPNLRICVKRRMFSRTLEISYGFTFYGRRRKKKKKKKRIKDVKKKREETEDRNIVSPIFFQTLPRGRWRIIESSLQWFFGLHGCSNRILISMVICNKMEPVLWIRKRKDAFSGLVIVRCKGVRYLKQIWKRRSVDCLCVLTKRWINDCLQ